MADSSQHELWYIEEVTRGTTPDAPAWKRVRDISCTLGLTKNSVISEESRGDRQIRRMDYTTQSLDGDIGTYLFYGDNDDLLEAGLCGSWAVDTPTIGTDQLKTGTTRRSFSFMRVFQDLGAGAKKYQINTGVEVNSVAVAVAVTVDAYITLTFSMVGSDLTLNTAAPAGSTYVEPIINKEPMVVTTADIKEGGSTIGTITEFSPSLENGMETRFAIGSALTRRPTLGNSTATGSITTYFEDTVLYEKFLNQTGSSMEITAADATGNRIRIVQPNIVYTGTRPDTASSGDVLLTMPYQALYDATNETNMYVERNPT